MQAAGSVSISGILDRVLQRRRWAHIVETRRDGVQAPALPVRTYYGARARRAGARRAICSVALLAKGAGHSLRNASCSSSRKTSVAAPRDSIRGSSTLCQHDFAVNPDFVSAAVLLILVI